MDLTAIGFALCTTFNLHPCNIDTVIAAWQSTPPQFVRMCDSRAGCPAFPSYIPSECFPEPIAVQNFTTDAGFAATRRWFKCTYTTRPR